MSFPFIFSLCLVCDENTHQYAKLVYFSSFMLIFQFGWACSQISHLSAIPALAQNQNERTSLTAIRYSVTIMSQVMVYLTGMNFLLNKVHIFCRGYKQLKFGLSEKHKKWSYSWFRRLLNNFMYKAWGRFRKFLCDS